jgi:protein subunit release factor A
MEQITNKEILEKLNQIQIDINTIKEKLNDEDGELTDWAKNELKEARKRKDKVSHDEVKRMILAK